MNRITARVRGLEQARHTEGQSQRADRPWWWDLPPDEWHTGRVGISHEDAIAELDAAPKAEGGR